MREVTEWDNNPRMMWVWDDDEKQRIKEFVVFVDTNPDIEDGYSGVCVIKKQPCHEAYTSRWFIHCAEIEPPRLMTNKELALWIRYKPNREWKRGDDEDTFVRGMFVYKLNEADKPVGNDIYVREGDSPWFVPFNEKETFAQNRVNASKFWTETGLETNGV